MLLQRIHHPPVSRIKSGYPGIRRPLEPLVAPLHNVAPRQSESTSGGPDASLCFQGLVGVGAVCHRDSSLPQTPQVATYGAKCRRNIPSGHETSPSQIHSSRHPQSLWLDPINEIEETLNLRM